MKRPTSRKLIGFMLVGAVNTVFGYLCFAALTALGWADVSAVPFAMAAGVVFNFVTYGSIVFKSLQVRRVPRFAAAYLALYACNILGLRALERGGLDAYHAQAILVLPLAVTMYFLNDQWVFRGA